jgi:cell division protein FtsL
MTAYLLIVCVILIALAVFCFAKYLTEQDRANSRLVTITRLESRLNGYRLDTEGMVAMQLADAATIRNLTASVEALSNEIDDERIEWARLMLASNTDVPIPFVPVEDNQ